MKQRIHKVLADWGVASRREIEGWIEQGRLEVNGEPAVLGQKIDENDRIYLEGRRLVQPKGREPLRVLVYKKRVGEIVTTDDPEGRRTVFRKLPDLAVGRWIAVGRLDLNTSGLLLMTNHGELARRLMHPSFEQSREYAVRVMGTVDNGLPARLQRGVELEDGMAAFDTVSVHQHQYEDDEDDAPQNSANQWFTVTVTEGRHRVVRRLFESQGLQVSRLIRIGYGPIKLTGGIKSASYRELEPEATRQLCLGVGLDEHGEPLANDDRFGQPLSTTKPVKFMSKFPEDGEDRPQRREFNDRPPRADGEFRPRRDFGDRPPRSFDPNSPRPPRREFGDRPQRSFDPNSPRPPRREFGDRPARPDGEFRPRRDFGDRPARDFGDRPQRSFDPNSPRPPRREFGDRPARPEGEFRPRRDFGDRPQRSFDPNSPRPPRRDFGDRPQRSFDPNSPRPPRRDFGDRPQRTFDPNSPRPPRRDFGDRPKPASRPQGSWGKPKDEGGDE
jgi:pseudouridine synthase